VEHYSPLAQSVERVTVNHHVRGSSPRWGAKISRAYNFFGCKPFLFCCRFVAVFLFPPWKDQEIATLKGELFVLKEQLDWLKRQIFGSKSERIVADLDQQLLLPELELGPVFVPAPEQEEIVYKRKKPSKNRGSDTISFPDNLPVEVIMQDLPADEKICPETGEPWYVSATKRAGNWRANLSSSISANMFAPSTHPSHFRNSALNTEGYLMPSFPAVRPMKVCWPSC
jgi:hypothetical protein